MLSGAGGVQEPAVIGDVDQNIDAFLIAPRKHKLPGQLTDGVFEANQRRNLYVRGAESKPCVLPAECEIAGDPPAGDGGEQRKRVPERDVFTKRDEVDFAIDLNL